MRSAVLVDDDTVVHREARWLGKRDVGGRADTDYDRLGVQVRAVCEFDTADVAVAVTGEGDHVHVVRNRTPRPPMHVEEHVGDAFARVANPSASGRPRGP